MAIARDKQSLPSLWRDIRFGELVHNMTPKQKNIVITLAWPADQGLVICICTGTVTENRKPNDEVCSVLILDVISCRVTSDTLSTQQLPVSDMPTDIQIAVSKLIGRTLTLNILRTEHELLQYINPP